MLSLLLALASLVAWVVLAVVLQIGGGLPHALLGAGTTLLVHWWGLTQ